ncbi:MAG: ATP-binding cassette domain-containing protein, partial [Bacillota bacterium]
MSNNLSPILELKNISKSFPGVKALDNVSLSIDGSSVMALVGENGAGKSTLIKIITGVYPTYEGTMLLHGNKIKFSNPRDAFNAGISVVHQERNLI